MNLWMISQAFLLCLNSLCICSGASVNAERVSIISESEATLTEENKVCPEVPCKGGFVCIGNTCEDLCASALCETNETCIYGQCYINGTFRTCEDIHCYSGQECYYDQIACLLPPCPPLPTCRSSKTDRCLERGCSATFFCDHNTGDCIPENEISCDTVKCSKNFICVLGRCTPVDPCSTIFCAEGFQCNEGLCRIDLCANVRCREGTHCANGRCKRNLRDCSIIRCPIACVDGRCVSNEADLDPCAVVKCSRGSHCVNGKCGANPMDFCALTLCVVNTTCFFGECLPNGSFKTCDDVKCDDGFQCELQQVNCFVPPCPPIPTCKPVNQSEIRNFTVIERTFSEQ